VKSATELTVRATYKDPEGDSLEYHWEVVGESDDRKAGGDAEKSPPAIPGCVSRTDDAGTATIRTPHTPGNYRLFVTVRDGHGSGCSDNWPFCVTAD